MRTLSIILLSLFVSAVAFGQTSLKRVDRPLVLSDGTLEVSADVAPLVDSDDSFETKKMSLTLDAEYSLSDNLAVSALSLQLPFDKAGDNYLFTLGPRATYLLGNKSGVDMAVYASTLLTEFGGDDAGARDDLGDNLKSWHFGWKGLYDLCDSTQLTGGLDLGFADMGDTDTYVVGLNAGLDWAVFKRLSVEPALQALFPTEGDNSFGATMPVYLTLSKDVDLGLVTSAADVENVGDTYSMGLSLLVRNK